MLLEDRGYIGTRDEFVTEFPTRETVYAEFPKKRNVRETWTEDGYRIINTAAPENGKIEYTSEGTTVLIESRYEAEIMDIIRNQPRPGIEELNVLRMVRATSGGFEQSIRLFQYGVMVGKHVERKRHALKENVTPKKHPDSSPIHILINAAPDGYSIEFQYGDGESNVYPQTLHSMEHALDYAFLLAAAAEKATGRTVEALVSAAAIRSNEDEDIAWCGAWKNMVVRVIE